MHCDRCFWSLLIRVERFPGLAWLQLLYAASNQILEPGQAGLCEQD